MHLKRVAVAVAALLVVAGVVAGIVTGGFATLVGAGLRATGLEPAATSSGLASNDPASTAGAGSPSSRGSSPAAPRTPTPAAPSPAALPPAVLATAGTKRSEVPAEVAARIAAVKAKKIGDFSGAVLDVGSGRTLYAHEAATGYIPASTMKLLTSAAVLSILGPEHTFSTRVVRPRAGQIVLVGGGDPYLARKTTARTFPARASVATLARVTAAALKKTGTKRVSLGYDDTLFRGARRSPTWPTSYGDVASPVSALWVDEGRVVGNGGIIGSRQSDPSRSAATVFAAALKKRGIAVSRMSPVRAARTAPRIAAVRSAPLARIVEQVLMTSDNDGAEVLLRQAAIGAGHPGTFAGGVQAVHERLAKLGAWRSGTRIYDGSGLSRQTRVSAAVMTGVLRAAAEPQHPELRAVITGLPVAGVEGSLRSRFFDDRTLTARGVVRGKTGTLRKVHTLAGLVRTRDGAVLVYAFLVNNPKNDYDAVLWLDRVAAALSTCGCR